ncbi:MAG: hypothetical protein WCY97_06620 [Methanothrix sp.]|jgi:hypothetical protein|nr:hypothetical protein [Methanothrix harundinacea]MDD2638125.1 hypothetical protein [Methanothrix sp.]MDD5767777.1 hypothetical protein [Methanothrix sp.]MDI9398649.1 hypothetical protein [Euryarchaeota archaeon]
MMAEASRSRAFGPLSRRLRFEGALRSIGRAICGVSSGTAEMMRPISAAREGGEANSSQKVRTIKIEFIAGVPKILPRALADIHLGAGRQEGRET